MRICIIFLLAISVNCLGQKQTNIWYFGIHSGVDFNSGKPVALLDGQTHEQEGTSVLCDSSGSLLFYSDGMRVWNKNHEIMENGLFLLGNNSSTQSSIAVPDPSDPNRHFYLFTVSSGFCCNGKITDGLRYSKIDMCLNNGLGGVITSEKNIKLVDTVTEKIAVTRHSNGIDYWILTHKFYSNKFCAIHLTLSGIKETVVSSIGTTHAGMIAGSQGQLKFSPNGKKIAIAASNGLNLLELFNFNTSTGIVSNHEPLLKPNNDRSIIYGVEFSPDNSKLYASGAGGPSFLAQYDLKNDSLNISASMKEIYVNTFGSLGGAGLQLGPDNKIYWVSLTNSQYLSVVNNPNISGSGCNYKDSAVFLGGQRGEMCVPTFIAGFDYSNKLIECKTMKAMNKVYILPNPSSTGNLNIISLDSILTEVAIYDMIGQLVFDRKFQPVSEFRETLNIAAGAYIIRCTAGNEVFKFKWLKVNPIQ